jgi:CheY-like chemotaxis protein
MKVTGRPIDILIVEDNPGDVRLTREALNEGRIANELHVAGDGVEALEYLDRHCDQVGNGCPDLILLDLNLPRLDGREVLARLKEDQRYRRIPVVVLTTSSAEADVLESYDLHANCYINKPVDFEQFIKVVRSIESFWLSVVRLPERA